MCGNEEASAGRVEVSMRLRLKTIQLYIFFPTPTNLTSLPLSFPLLSLLTPGWEVEFPFAQREIEWRQKDDGI